MKKTQLSQDAIICNPKQKNKKISKKSIIIFLIFLLLFFIIFYNYYGSQIKEKINSEKSVTISQNGIDNNILIDDKLSKDYPIMFITSPASTSEGLTYVTILCLYNDGKYVTTYYFSKDMDSYYKEIESTTAFVENLKDNYSSNISTEVSNFLTENISPSDIRDTYLNQYSIKDFSLEETIDISSTEAISFDVFGITYEKTDNNIVSSAHRYFSIKNGTTKTIIDKTGQDILNKFLYLGNEDLISQ